MCIFVAIWQETSMYTSCVLRHCFLCDSLNRVGWFRWFDPDCVIFHWFTTPGGTQLWVGYGCAARSFDHHPITKPEKTANLQPITKPFASWRTLFKTNQYFLPYKLGCISTFWQPIGKLKGKIQRKLCIMRKCDLYLNQFSNKKGAIGKPERPKWHPIWAAHPRTHLSTKYPPPIHNGKYVVHVTAQSLYYVGYDLFLCNDIDTSEVESSSGKYVDTTLPVMDCI